MISDISCFYEQQFQHSMLLVNSVLSTLFIYNLASDLNMYLFILFKISKILFVITLKY